MNNPCPVIVTPWKSETEQSVWMSPGMFRCCYLHSCPPCWISHLRSQVLLSHPTHPPTSTAAPAPWPPPPHLTSKLNFSVCDAAFDSSVFIRHWKNCRLAVFAVISAATALICFLLCFVTESIIYVLLFDGAWCQVTFESRREKDTIILLPRLPQIP